MIGNQLAHYKITEKLGSGGMGDVYRARDTKLDRDVALKILPEHLASDPERRARFEREARVIAQLKHPNIVTIYSVEEADGVHFLTMELVDGPSLDSLIQPEGINLGRFFELAIPLAEAVASAHAKNITHRDLKPANVMIDEEGHLKVLDFGLAKLFTPALEEAETIADQAQTAEGRILGTVAYMSPEQAEGKQIDHRTDIFSLGIILFEMATGKRPFQGESSLSVLSSILKDTPPSVSDLRNTLPVQLGRIIQHCLEKDPQKRFQSALDIANELAALRTEVSSQSGLSRETVIIRSAPARRVRLLPLVAAVAVVGIVAVVFATGLFKRGSGGVADARANSLAVFVFENLKDSEDPERYGQILQELLISDLSALGRVKIVSSQRLNDVSRQLGARSESPPAASEVARRAGAETMLTGSLSQLGDRWILTCQIANVSDGTVVQSKRIDGADLFAIVDELADAIQTDLNIAEPTEVGETIAIEGRSANTLDAYREFLSGVDKINTNEYGEAAADFERAIELDPNFGRAYYKLALAKWWPGTDYSGASKVLQEMLDKQLYTSEKEKLTAEALLDMTNHQQTEALPKYEKLIEEYPDDKEVWYGYGEALFHHPTNTRKNEALPAFEKAAELDPDFLLPYQHIFDIYFMNRQYDEAVARADALIARDPTRALWYRYRAEARCATADPNAVSGIVAEALPHQREPEDRRELYRDVGTRMNNRGFSRLAEEYLRKALAADPDHQDDQIEQVLAGFLQNQARWEEYDTWVASRLEINPKDENQLGRQYWIHMRRGEFGDAAALARARPPSSGNPNEWYRRWARAEILGGDETALARAVEQARAHAATEDDRRRLEAELAYGYWNAGYRNAATRHLRRAIAAGKSGDFPDMVTNLGWLETERGRGDVALACFDAAIEVHPMPIGARFGRAIVHLKRGENDIAAQEFRMVVNMLPPGASDAKWETYALLLEGRSDEALRVTQAALDELHDSYDIWQFIIHDPPVSDGFLLFGLQDEALALYERAAALDISKRASSAYEGIGWIRLWQGDINAARTAFEKAVKNAQHSDDEAVGLATAEIMAGKFDAAERVIDTYAAGFRSEPYFMGLRAHIRSAQGRHDEAITIARQALEADSSRATHEDLAWCLLAGGDAAGALREAQVALPLFSDLKSNRFALPYRAVAEHTAGRAMIALGRAAEAVPLLEKAAELQPAREGIRDDLKRAISP